MESRFNDRLAHRRSPDSKLFISLSLSFFACRYEGEEREVTDKMAEIIFQSSSFVYYSFVVDTSQPPWESS